MGWVIRYFSRSSKLNNITNLMAHPRNFGHKIFANGWGIINTCIDRCIMFLLVGTDIYNIELYQLVDPIECHFISVKQSLKSPAKESLSDLGLVQNRFY